MSNKTKNKGGTMKICFKKSFTKMVALLFFVIVVMVDTSCTSKKIIDPILQSGLLCVRLTDDVMNEVLNEFLLEYAKYDLTLTYHDRRNNRYNFTFNHYEGENVRFLELIRKDSRVVHARLDWRLPDWAPGMINVQLYDHVRDEILCDFVASYSKYELRIEREVYPYNYFYLSFNYELVDEFDFVEMIENDDHVIWASFIYDIALDLFITNHQHEFYENIEEKNTGDVK